jgi:hypothetical protein
MIWSNPIVDEIISVVFPIGYALLAFTITIGFIIYVIFNAIDFIKTRKNHNN